MPVRRDGVDLGLLVDTPQGLLIAVINDAQDLDLADMSQAISTDPSSIPADLKAIFDVTKVAGVNTLKLSVESVRPPKLS